MQSVQKKSQDVSTQTIEKILRVQDNPYIPHNPTDKQWEFLLSEEKDVMFGGAAGPGKSDALLMAALMYVDFHNYHAILFRRTFPNLNQAGGLIPRSREWMTNTNARYNGGAHRWTFPSGATLSFGHIHYSGDEYDYNSAEFQYIGFDEAAEFLERQFTYLFSRLRKTKDNPVPLRFRSASNPIGPGFRWVRNRYVRGDKKFISAQLEDNPHVDKEEYEDTLSNLDPITRKKLLEGNWEVTNRGAIYSKFTEDGNIVSDFPEGGFKRFWVGVDYGIQNPTVFLLLGLGVDGNLYIISEWRHAGSAQGSSPKTDSEYSKAMQEWLRSMGDRFSRTKVYLRPKWIYVDPSAASFIQQLYRDRSSCPAFKRVTGANNEVLDGIRRVSSLVGLDMLKVHESCEKTIDEFYDYSWDENAKDRGDDKPEKKSDHSMDALRYVVNGLHKSGVYRTIVRG